MNNAHDGLKNQNSISKQTHSLTQWGTDENESSSSIQPKRSDDVLEAELLRAVGEV